MKTVGLKTIGASGQISLGKQYAGRTVIVEEVEHGVWLIKSARVIPENEFWLHTEPARGILAAAIEWAEKNPPHASNLDVLALTLERR